MRVSVVLTLKTLGPGDGAGYYLQSLPDGPAQYYLDGRLAGRWLGSGAARLDLDGPVDAEHFRRVLQGAHPVTGQMLVTGRAAGAGRTPGYDLTFSPPKSVTLLAVLADPETGEQVREAHRRAVTDTMALVEAEVAAARRGDGGTRQLRAELVAAGFEHHTSRAVDPQLHTHVVVANLGWAADGRWSALHGQRLYGWAKTAGTLYQAALRAELTGRLGVRWGPVRNGTAEIAGFARSQLEAFSTRRTEIRAELERVGQTSARSAQLAAWATRHPKVELPEQLLVERWQTRAARVGITTELVDARTGRPRFPVPGPAGEDVAERLLGPDGLTARVSAFDRRHVLQAVANCHPDGLAVAAAAARAGRVLADRRTVPLPAPTRLGDRRYSTVELMVTETELLGRAVGRRTAGVGRADPVAVTGALAGRPSLAEEQRRMVETVTGSGAGVQCVVGVAGAGKTFALDAARKAWEDSGVTVIGAALAARAAAELQSGAGIPSTTLDRLLVDAEQPGPAAGLPYRGVVVVDEAGMVGTRKLARLLSLAERSQTAVVLVGDPRQLPEIDAGGAFAALTDLVPTVELHTNRRQHQGWEREALADLRAGDVTAAVTAYRDRDRIHVFGDAESAREHLVDDWWAARQDGQQGDMYALRRSDVDDLNRRARVRMARSGLLKGDSIVAAERRYAVGDRVLALRNDRRLKVLNGTRGTVCAVDHESRSVTVRTGDTTVMLPAGYLDAGHLGHGYATTIHKAQGATVDRSFLLGSDTLYREAGYTGLSRNRVRSDLYIVAPTPTTPGQDRPVDPIERLAADLGRSNAQRLATPHNPPPPDHSLADLEDERDRLRQHIGPPPPAPDGNAEHQLAQARAAREDAERRLESLPHRHRSPTRETVERELTVAATREWRAAEQLGNEQQTRAISQRWLADHAEPLAAYHQLTVAIDQRRHADQTAALADPAPHHLDALGLPPLIGPGRQKWAHAAVTIDGYRQRWHITDPAPLGPDAVGVDQARQRQAAQHSIDAARRFLRLDHSLDHGLEL